MSMLPIATPIARDVSAECCRSPFRVYLLGRFQLLTDDEPVRFSRRIQRKPLELLQAVIAFGGTEVGASTLTDALWPDSEGDAGYHALESALYRLRQLLGTPDAVRMVGSKVSLNRHLFWVDVWELERGLQSGGASVTELAARLARMRELYAGHFLEHETERPWAIKAREALRDRFLRHLRDAARVYESRRLWDEAARVYQTGLELDVLAEDLSRGLMLCHRELGDHSEALQAYRRCREFLTRFLGVPPNAKTQSIYHSVRQSAGISVPEAAA
jgi:LuxR family transcriptional regulator, maltose regulon positive regulatory protein